MRSRSANRAVARPDLPEAGRALGVRRAVLYFLTWRDIKVRYKQGCFRAFSLVSWWDSCLSKVGSHSRRSRNSCPLSLAPGIVALAGIFRSAVPLMCLDIDTDGRVKVSPLNISTTAVEEFRASVLLYYTGIS